MDVFVKPLCIGMLKGVMMPAAICFPDAHQVLSPCSELMRAMLKSVFDYQKPFKLFFCFFYKLKIQAPDFLFFQLVFAAFLACFLGLTSLSQT